MTLCSWVSQRNGQESDHQWPEPIRRHDQAPRSTLMDKRGEGVPLILERTEQISGKKPVYRLIDDSELLLVVPSARLEETA